MEEAQSSPVHLPGVNKVAVSAPLGWLAKGWADFWRAPGPSLAYGVALAAISFALAGGLYLTGAFTWFLVLAGGFLLVAPMLAMGAYQSARLQARGEVPSLAGMFFVRSAFRRDLVILGVALFILFGIWVEAAYLVYGLSTRTMHTSVSAFLNFLFLSPEGHSMALTGSLVGGVIAFLAFSLAVVSAPMMLNAEVDFFIATITSVRAVVQNFPAMLVWAVLIAVLTGIGIATAFIGLIIVFPWIGMASWHAYRELVAS